MASPYDELQQLLDRPDPDAALDYLEQVVRREHQYAQLFDVLKMRVRRRLGLPLLQAEMPDGADTQRQLEDGLLAACREVGTLFVQSGALEQGWMYLQPVGDRELNETLIRQVPVTEDTLDSIVEIAVSQGAAPAYGYALLLQHYGTCNGITTFDTQAMRFDRATQVAMAEILVNHLYAELMNNVAQALGDAIGAAGTAPTLAAVMRQFPELTAGGGHHIDTTHLASLMRIARLAENPEGIQKAYELAEYGRGLAGDFQYPGHPPFEETYVAHRHYFGALLGQDVDAAIRYFDERLDQVNTDQYGPIAIETLIELLVRLGRHAAALSLMVNRWLGKHESLGVAPPPWSILQDRADIQRLAEYYQGQDDLMGFATCLLAGADLAGTPAA